MKLLFPNGEHAQALLSPGVNRIGSAADGQVVLAQPGVAANHCELNVQGESATLTAADASAPVTVNGVRLVRHSTWPGAFRLIALIVSCGL